MLADGAVKVSPYTSRVEMLGEVGAKEFVFVDVLRRLFLQPFWLAVLLLVYCLRTGLKTKSTTIATIPQKLVVNISLMVEL